ncbi:MAG: Appr-1-p processing protein [Polyangiales bacterium]
MAKATKTSKNTKLTVLNGDATAPVGSGPRVIAHICNDIGGWGSGFVVAVSKRWRQPEADFRAWYKGRHKNDFALGAVRFVEVEEQLWVANMVGQHTIKATKDGPPIRYRAVKEALASVGDFALERGASVHMPRIGCGLAGGTWDRVGPIVQRQLGARGVEAFVYDFAP